MTITITSDGYNATNASTAINASLVFNPTGSPTTGGNPTGGNNGVTYSSYSTTVPGGTVTYFENDFPGLVWEPTVKAFTLGNSTGLTAADVTSSLSNAAGAPTGAGVGFYTLSLNFPTGNFTGGKVLRFTHGRGAQRSSTTGSSTTPVAGTTTVNSLADLFGNSWFIPRNVAATNAMTFSGTLTDGSTFSGTLQNRIGFGYSKVDGYGLINAQQAVSAPLP